jgi:hypothetical protein
MSYVYCRNCGWSQDDFWGKSYNPFEVIRNKNWHDDIYEDIYKCDNLDDVYKYRIPFATDVRWLSPREYEENLKDPDLDKEWLTKFRPITYRQYALNMLDRAASDIKKMVYPTHESCKKAGWKCPHCEHELTED